MLYSKPRTYESDDCTTTGFPFTLKTFKDTLTLDLNPDAEPDLVADFSLPTILPENTFEIVTTGCCRNDVFIDDDGRLREQTFENIIKVLVPGGHFILSSTAGLMFMTFVKKQTTHDRPWWPKDIVLDRRLLNSFTDDKWQHKDYKQLVSDLSRLFYSYVSYSFPQLVRVTEPVEFIRTMARKYIEQDEVDEFVNHWPNYIENDEQYGDLYFDGAIYRVVK